MLLPFCLGAVFLQYQITMTMLRSHQSSQARYLHQIPKDMTAQSLSLLPLQSKSENEQTKELKHSRRLRILFGILSADIGYGRIYRKRHRDLFQLWNDPRVCPMDEFKKKSPQEREQCELVYVFVMGGNPEAPPSLLDDSRPFEVTMFNKNKSGDVDEPNTILLNIRENMNDGKSPTWMYYGSKLARKYDLDYVVKCDEDSILHLHEFFRFAYKHLPPAPYNTNVFVGAPRDKAFWPQLHNDTAEREQYEAYFGNVYEGVHLYLAGQLYIMSADLAYFTGIEARRSNCSYCEGFEDHDVSALAFHSPDPLKLMLIGRPHRFWEHPVKSGPRWKRIWDRESHRVAGTPFTGKMFLRNSTFEALFPNL